MNTERPVDFEVLVHSLGLGEQLVAHRALLGGVSAEVHALELRGPQGERTVVARRHRRPGSTAAREHGLMRLLDSLGVPVPRPLALRRQQGRDILVMEWVDGQVALPSDSETAIVQMAARLAQVHAVPVEQVAGLGLPSRVNPVPELMRWLPQLGIDGPHLEHLSTLQGALPQPHLLHGDFWPGNLMWSDGVIAALMDWEDAALGDRMADLACARCELLCVLGEAAADRLLQAYVDMSPHADTRTLPMWDLHVASWHLLAMGGWGLPASEETARRHMTRRLLDRSLRRALQLPAGSLRGPFVGP